MISSRVRYAVRGVFQLALRHPGGPVSLAEIARLEKIPTKYLESVFAALRREGVVRSLRGKNGGYELGRAPRNISLMEVISVFEPAVLVDLDESSAERLTWGELERNFRDRLGSVTFADLVDRARKANEALNYAI